MPKFNKKLTSFSAFDYALFLVSMRAQSEGQLREKLLRKKYEKKESEEAIKRLKELKYLDDGQFAQIYLDNLKKYKHFGYYGIKKKLMEKKFPKAMIEELLSHFSLKDEREIAKRFLESSAAVKKTKEQQMRMLQNRGFRSEVVMKVRGV
jgi:regulatory protein